MTANLLATTREVIYTHREGDGDVFQLIGFVLDIETGCLVLSQTFEIFGFEDEDDARQILALAVSDDVPVYPDSEGDVPRLSMLYESLYSKGFTAAGEDGDDVRLMPKFKPAHGGELRDLDFAATKIQPMDYYLRESAQSARIQRLVDAERTLAAIRLGIEELSQELDRDVRDESALQRILTARPALLGPEFRQILPKHALGGQYEMDYAAVTAGGVVHCIEIEPSSLRLFTRAGDPRAGLVHAEQQVLDWLDWMDRNSHYASTRLPPSMLRPAGTVIIGRSGDLSEQDEKRLKRRNLSWGGTLRVLTYDDLIDQAQLTLNWLTTGFGQDE